MPRILYQVDAFTDRLFGGNPAGVVPDAAGLDDRAMQSIAREMNCSETAFVTAPTRPGATHRVRFFTPAREVKLCGHATIATFHVLAERRELPGNVVMECGAGEVPIEVLREGGRTRITMTQGKASFVDAPFRGVVSQSVGLPPDVVSPKPPPQLVSTAVWIAILPVLAVDVLSKCAPVAAKIRALGGARAVDGVYVVALGSEMGPIHEVRSRFFGAEGLGIVEDPATGVAAGALGAWLVKHARLGHGEALVVEQGVECGRASTLHVTVPEGGHPRVSGTAVTAFQTTIDV